MFKKFAVSTLTILAALSVNTAAQAADPIYQFNFLANPGADGGDYNVDPANDIAMRFTVDTNHLPSLSIETLNESSFWKNGAYRLEMTHAGKTVLFNDSLASTSGPLRLLVTDAYGWGAYEEGSIEIYGDIDEFFDIDLHPGSTFVDNNGLSMNAFVYGQIDAYNNQTAFQDLFTAASTGQLAGLTAYQVSSVPEPTGLALTLGGLVAVAATVKRRQKSRDAVPATATPC